MSKVIGEVNLSPSSIEGTPDQVAVHIFEKSFVQVLKSFSKTIRKLQSFCISHFWFSTVSTSRVSFNQKSR